jgi:hypothetical protein
VAIAAEVVADEEVEEPVVTADDVVTNGEIAVVAEVAAVAAEVVVRPVAAAEVVVPVVVNPIVEVEVVLDDEHAPKASRAARMTINEIIYNLPFFIFYTPLLDNKCPCHNRGMDITPEKIVSGSSRGIEGVGHR